MQNVAQSWLVWELTRSPFAIGVVAFFDSMPRLLVGAFGGAIADRFDRRRVLLITQTLIELRTRKPPNPPPWSPMFSGVWTFPFYETTARAWVWLAVWFGVIAFWHIVVLSFFLGIVNTINQTARQSLVNSLVPKDELLNAIGLQSSVFNFSKILGPSAGGVIIGFIGIADCFLVNALSFLALILPGRNELLSRAFGQTSKKDSSTFAAAGASFILFPFRMSWRCSVLPITDSFPSSRPTFCALDRPVSAF